MKKKSTTNQDVTNLEGINIQFFKNHCPFLHGMLAEVKTRLFNALGIDTENRNSEISWELFVELYCIVELGRLSSEKLIKFWIKFIDPVGRGSVPAESYMPILEKLIRGKSVKNWTEGTLMFAESF